MINSYFNRLSSACHLNIYEITVHFDFRVHSEIPEKCKSSDTSHSNHHSAWQRITFRWIRRGRLWRTRNGWRGLTIRGKRCYPIFPCLLNLLYHFTTEAMISYEVNEVLLYNWNKKILCNTNQLFEKKISPHYKAFKPIFIWYPSEIRRCSPNNPPLHFK